MGTSSALANAGISNETANASEDLPETTVRAHDWRVRMCLAPNADYLYMDSENSLLQPLAYTDGVIFPYTPAINITYAASYEALSPTHSNYNVYNYAKSSIDTITISCDFTAQDTAEANYLLAVIHFFRSLTKMAYGQGANPTPGTPPPLVFLHGLGSFQFSGQALVVNSFTYSLPTNVDYIRASGYTAQQPTQEPVPPPGGGSASGPNSPPKPSWVEKAKKATTQAITSAATTAADRLKQGVVSGLGSVVGGSRLGTLLKGGVTPGSATVLKSLQNNALSAAAVTSPNGGGATYVPTQIQLQINCYPIVSRYKARKFNYADYANGTLNRLGYW